MAGGNRSLAGLWTALLAIPLWLRACVWVILLMLRHVQAHVLHPIAEWWLNTIVGTWEESLKSIIREAFSNTTRFVNGFFAWMVSLFVDRDYKTDTNSNFQRQTPWQRWWMEPRTSTFNALIRRDQGRRSGDGRLSLNGKLSLHFAPFQTAHQTGQPYKISALVHLSCKILEKPWAEKQFHYLRQSFADPLPRLAGSEEDDELEGQSSSASIAHTGGWSNWTWRRSAEKEQAKQDRKDEELADRMSRPKKGAVWSLFSWTSKKKPASEEPGLRRTPSDLFGRHSGESNSPDCRLWKS